MEDLYRIVGNNNDHNFPMGIIVRKVSNFDDNGECKCEYLDGHDYWFVLKTDIEHLDKHDSKVLMKDSNNEETNENEGDNDMNKVLELWKERKDNEIDKVFEETVINEYESLDIVKEFNEIQNEYDIKMAMLMDKYNTYDATYISRYGIGYKLEQNKLQQEIRNNHNDEKFEKIKDLEKVYDEVNAQLSLSNDLDYQLKVLKDYKITKNGKINA